MNYLGLKRRRDLAAKKWQYGAAALTVFLGVLLFAASYDAYRNLDASYRGTYARLAFANMTVSGADPGFIDTAAGLPGVAAAASRVQADVPMRLPDGHTFLGRLVGMPAGTQPAVDKLDIQSGAYLSSATTSTVIAEIHMFDHFKLTQGDAVEFFDGSAWRDLKIGGSAVSPEYIWPARSAQDVITNPDDFGVLFVDMSVVKALPAALTQTQTLILYEATADVANTDAAVRSAAVKAGATSVVTQADQPSNKALQLDVLGFQQMAVAFPFMFLLAAGMATYTMLTRLVYREREIIGTLRANGLGRGEIVRHYLSYGLWLGTGAGVLGVVLGIPAGWAMTLAYTADLGIPDTVRQFHWITPVVGIAFGVIAGFVSAWVPARQAASLDPAEAMRGDLPLDGGRLSLFERIIPPLRRLPVRWRMVLRGIGRNRKRSMSTVLGVVLALVLILSSWGLLDTTNHLLDRQFKEIELEDVSAVFNAPVTPVRVAEVEAVAGVSKAEPVQALGVSVQGPTGRYATQLLGFEQGTTMHQFGARGLPADGVLLGSSIQEKTGVKTGDTITLSFTGLDTSAQVKVAGFVDEPLGTFAYMRSDALRKVLAAASPAIVAARLDQPDATIVMARFDAGADRAAVIAAIRALPDVATVTDARMLYNTVQQFMGLFYVFVALMLGFGGLMAFALIFNTMSVNLAERAGELATMRANGLSRRETAALVVGENILLTLIGIPPGLLAGWWAAGRMMASYSSDMFVFDLYIAPMTYVWCALAMVGVTLVSLWPGIRAAGRVDIGSVVRQRAV